MTTRNHGGPPAAERFPIPPCPICGSAPVEVAVDARDMAREIALREKFFAQRFATPPRRDADVRDVSHVAFSRAAPLLRCPRCDVYVRGAEEGEELFACDRYDERTLESLRQFHVSEFGEKQWVRPLLPPDARVLEVGSYVGGFLETAKAWGWRATGIDIGEDTREFTCRRGLDVLEKPLEEADLPAQSFHGIFIWNCFEQLVDPQLALERCRELLRPNGVLVLRVPDAGAYVANRTRPAFLAYSNLLGFPHRFGFTGQSLEAICRAKGFACEGVRHEPAMRPHREALAMWAQAEEAELAPAAWIEAVFRRAGGR